MNYGMWKFFLCQVLLKRWHQTEKWMHEGALALGCDTDSGDQVRRVHLQRKPDSKPQLCMLLVRHSVFLGGQQCVRKLLPDSSICKASLSFRYIPWLNSNELQYKSTSHPCITYIKDYKKEKKIMENKTER